MRKPLVAGNWKMHGSRTDNADLVRTLLDRLKPESRAEVMVCPPFVYLLDTGRLLKHSAVELGAQSHRRALHGEQVVRLGHEHAQVREFQEAAEGVARSDVALHRVVEPVVGRAGSGGNTRRGLAHGRRGFEDRVDVSCGVPGMKREAHDRTADHVQFPDGLHARQLLVQKLKELKDAVARQPRH